MLSNSIFTPSIPAVTRAVVPTELARAATRVQWIAPAPAITKDRNTVKNQVPDGLVLSDRALALAQQDGLLQQSSPSAAERAPSTDGVPVAKTPVQKALDVQIRELLTTVWKASAAAVDFLLNREQTPDVATVESSQEGGLAKLNLSRDRSPIKAAKAFNAVASSADAQTPYTKAGLADMVSRPIGQVLNLTA
jgi:hypothetical protein